MGAIGLLQGSSAGFPLVGWGGGVGWLAWDCEDSAADVSADAVW